MKNSGLPSGRTNLNMFPLRLARGKWSFTSFYHAPDIYIYICVYIDIEPIGVN